MKVDIHLNMSFASVLGKCFGSFFCGGLDFQWIVGVLSVLVFVFKYVQVKTVMIIKNFLCINQ